MYFKLYFIVLYYWNYEPNYLLQKKLHLITSSSMEPAGLDVLQY